MGFDGDSCPLEGFWWKQPDGSKQWIGSKAKRKASFDGE